MRNLVKRFAPHSSFVGVLAALILAACTSPHRSLRSTVPSPTAGAIVASATAVPATRAATEATLATASATTSARGSAESTPQPPDSTDVPPADPFALAYRLLHLDAPRSLAALPVPHQIGERANFWVEDSEASQAVMTTAVLRYTGAHAYVYLQQRAQVDDTAIVRAGEDFDGIVYPLVAGDVGPPAMPGIDGDPRITILLADLRGMGGYFTEIDNEPQSIERTSNQRKMIYIDLGSAHPGTANFNVYVAHEFQHLVHFNRNPGAQAWINEGMSEVVREQVTHSLLNIPKYEDQPNTQLNDWPTLGDDPSLPHYGAAHSFLRYLLQHYGGIEQAGALAGQKGDGIAEVRAYLRQGGYAASFEDVFEDWLAANLINDPNGGRFSQNDPAIKVQEVRPLADPSQTGATVHQFGANYYAIALGSQPVSIDFRGAITVPAIPAAPPDNGSIWWSRRGDSIDSSLTRAVDLTGVDRAGLHFSTWYDIEKDYDFGYVEVSTDTGATWTALKTAHTTDVNPFAIALGPAYSGASGGGNSPIWIEESVDLSPFARKQIALRFEYVTDESANRNGWAIGGLQIPEIGFEDHAETNDGWQLEGFARLSGPLPQRFLVQVILDNGNGGVQRLQLDSQNHATFMIPAGTRRAVLIVSGATDLIRTEANYQISVRPSGG
ncbi:MAG: hypothetical protein ACR2PL_00650 [Dehalococcoidia bacterium]